MTDLIQINHQQIEEALIPYLKQHLSLEVHATLASTNLYLKQQTPLVPWQAVIATQQTGGRGQHGHVFDSPFGGLYLSVAVPFEKSKPVNAFRYTAAAGVAVAETIQATLQQKVRLKWVNDVYDYQRKIAGILTEGVLDTEGTLAGIVVGVGLNFASTIATQRIGNLSQAVNAHQVNINQFCATYLNRLAAGLAQADEAIVAHYCNWSAIIGRRLQNGLVITQLLADGTLILSNGSQVAVGQKIDFKEELI